MADSSAVEGAASTPGASVTKRVLSTLILVPVVLFCLGSPWLWAMLIAVGASAAAGEAALMRSKGTSFGVIERLLAVGMTTVMSGLAYKTYRPFADAGEALTATIAIGVALSFVVQILRSPERRSSTDWAWTLAIPMYIGGLASFGVRLRAVEGGLAWTLLLLLLVWTNDSAAYFGGRTFGRHPMAPNISPKKTWEGTAIGTLATILVAVLLGILSRGAFGHDYGLGGIDTVPFGWLAVIGCAVSIAGPIGDLSQSFLKRELGAKDSSHLIPGHGGVWDRIDSLLFAAPVVYLVARLLGA